MQYPEPPRQYHAFDPDDMELDVDSSSHSQPSSGGSSPPDTPIDTPGSTYGHSSFSRSNSHPGSSCASPHIGSPPVSAFDTVILPYHHHPVNAFPPSIGGRPAHPTVVDMFNQYSGYSDYSSCMPGTVPSPPAYDDQAHSASEPGSPSGCVPPALLFSSNENTPVSTPASSRLPSPTATGSSYFTASPGGSTSQTSRQSSTASVPKPDPSNATPRASTTLSRPASSLLLSKPFRCPKPNCNKSYKQANGLKYHMTHGSCNFAPPKDLEQVQALLASKRSQRQAAEANGEEVDPASAAYGMISEGEMREVEREAERRLRPFACGVSDCQRRYKNMNGLRYHYQHSGDHGAIGLALLASGQHECLQQAHKSAHNSRHTTPGGHVGGSSAQPQSQQPHQQIQHFQQQQMQSQQMNFAANGQQQQPQQQFVHSQPLQHTQLPVQFANSVSTPPMAMPNGGNNYNRDTYMSQ